MKKERSFSKKIKESQKLLENQQLGGKYLKPIYIIIQLATYPTMSFPPPSNLHHNTKVVIINKQNEKNDGGEKRKKKNINRQRLNKIFLRGGGG